MIQELILGGSLSTTTTSAYSGGGIISAEATKAATSKCPSEAANNISHNSSNPEQNLRCPRCDSSNTKFCYYNNYNLTQPRHFCKTCRRYWTKGGALRNVPIGGGCRKNRSSFTGKPRVFSTSADMLLKSGFLNPQESSLHHPIMWSSPPQPQTSSHLLDILRTTQNPNPSNHTSYLISSAPLQSSNQAPTMFNAMNVLNNQTSISGLEYHFESFLRNKNQTMAQPQHLQVHQQQNKVAQQQIGGVQQNSGIQELYLSSGVNDITNYARAVLANGLGVSVSSSPTTSSRPTLESSQVTTGGGESDSRLWNNTPDGDYSTWTNDHLHAAANGDVCHF